MVDSKEILTLIIASLAFLVFVYRNISSAALKSKLLKLCIRRKNSFKHDSFNECLQDQRNHKLLKSLFYRVTLIDIYVKKVIPLVLFSSVIIMILAFFIMDKGYDFRIQPTSEIKKVSITKNNGDIEILKKEHLVYLTSDEKLIHFKVDSNGIYSFGNEYVTRLGIFVFCGVIAIMVVLALALAYFKNINSVDEVGDSIEEDIRLLKEEIESVENMIKGADIKPDGDFKVERIDALEKKVSNLKDILQDITEMGNQLSKISS
jgi:hypothetical protein